MRIDTFGLPVQIQHGGEVKKMIPPSFRRPNKAEAREQEMEKLRRICGCKGRSGLSLPSGTALRSVGCSGYPSMICFFPQGGRSYAVYTD